MVESQGVASIGISTRWNQLARATLDAAKSQPEVVHWYSQEYQFHSVMLGMNAFRKVLIYQKVDSTALLEMHNTTAGI